MLMRGQRCPRDVRTFSERARNRQLTLLTNKNQKLCSHYQQTLHHKYAPKLLTTSLERCSRINTWTTATIEFSLTTSEVFVHTGIVPATDLRLYLPKTSAKRHLKSSEPKDITSLSKCGTLTRTGIASGVSDSAKERSADTQTLHGYFKWKPERAFTFHNQLKSNLWTH